MGRPKKQASQERATGVESRAKQMLKRLHLNYRIGKRAIRASKDGISTMQFAKDLGFSEHTVRKLKAFAHEVLPLWFGGNLETARALHIQGSPLYWVTPNAATTLCIHGTEDKYVAHEQAVWLVDKLKAATVEAELLTLPGAGHGFKGDDAEKAEAAMLEFSPSI